MNSRLFLFLTLCFLVFLTSSCDDIIEKDIEEETIALVAPNNGLISNQSYLQFWWEELEGSDSYQIQIVSPSFDMPTLLVLDSFVLDTRFSYTLLEGKYEWRVTGVNDAYESKSEVFQLEILNDSSAILSNKTITEIFPINESCLSESNIEFSWAEVAQAEVYQLQISTDEDFSDLLVQTFLTDNFYNYSLPGEDQYYWRVRAENQQTLTFTPWATANILLDQTSPDVPILIAPLEGAILITADQNPDLTWSAAADSFADTLYVYADELTNGLVLKTAVENGAYDLEDSPIDFNLFPGEDFFWEVVSTDKAGNQSVPGELRLFFISN